MKQQRALGCLVFFYLFLLARHSPVMVESVCYKGSVQLPRYSRVRLLSGEPRAGWIADCLARS